MKGEHLALVEHLYQVAIDPYSFDNLLVEWELTLQRALQDETTPVPDLAFLDGHAERANQILDKLEHSPGRTSIPALSDVIELDPNPALLLLPTGTIAAANQAAENQFSIHAGMDLTECLGHQVETPLELIRLREQLASDADPQQCLLGLFELYSDSHNQSVLFAASRAHCAVDRRIVAMMTALTPVWSEQTQNAVKEYFGLTPAELEVVLQLMVGTTVSQISVARQTSIHTVRVQVRSILAKTNFSSQLDLVRHMGFLQRYEPISSRAHGKGRRSKESIATSPQRFFFRTQAGSQIEYMIAGPEDGKPVLFVHGIVDSTRFPASIVEQLYRHSIRIIAPSRASYGATQASTAGGNSLDDFCNSAVELLDQIGYDRVTVLCHMAGTLYGVALAGKFPERVNVILFVAGAVPMVHRWQFDGMSTGHRIAGLTARYAPTLIPVLVKGGIQLVRGGRKECNVASRLQGNRSRF